MNLIFHISQWPLNPRVFLFTAYATTSMLHAAPVDTLSLEECVRDSVTANHPVLAREAEAAAARERVRGSRAARMPKLFLQGDLQHTNDPQRLAPATANNQMGMFTRDTGQAALGFAVPLYTGGRLSAEENAAELLTKAADSDLEYARQALAARVVELYQEVLALGGVIQSLDQ